MRPIIFDPKCHFYGEFRFIKATKFSPSHILNFLRAYADLTSGHLKSTDISINSIISYKVASGYLKQTALLYTLLISQSKPDLSNYPSCV